MAANVNALTSCTVVWLLKWSCQQVDEFIDCSWSTDRWRDLKPELANARGSTAATDHVEMYCRAHTPRQWGGCRCEPHKHNRNIVLPVLYVRYVATPLGTLRTLPLGTLATVVRIRLTHDTIKQLKVRTIEDNLFMRSVHQWTTK